MKKKAIMAALSITAILISLVGMQLVEVATANFFPPSVPSPAITITRDGSVVPQTAPITRVNDVYTLTDNIVGYTIVVQLNNLVIDGNGYTLQGNGNSTGVFLQDTQNLTLRNLTIKGCSRGVWFTWGSAPDQGAKNNIITNNTITNNTYGIDCALFTSNNTIAENTITSNEYGTLIYNSPYNVLRNNHLSENRYNLWVNCLTAHPGWEFINDIDSSNTVDGKPVYYWVGEKNRAVPSDAGYVALIRCSGITVEGLTLSHNGQGVLLVETNNSKVTQNHITQNNYGVALFGMYSPCTNNIVTQNRMSNNTQDIFTYLEDSTNTIGDNSPDILIPTSTPSFSPSFTPQPTLTPASSPSPSPSPSPAPTVTIEPTQQPSPTPETSDTPQPTEVPGQFGFSWVEVALAVAVLAVGGVAAYFLRRSQKHE